MKFRGLLALACAGVLMAGCHGNRTSNTVATSNEAAVPAVGESFEKAA